MPTGYVVNPRVTRSHSITGRCSRAKRQSHITMPLVNVKFAATRSRFDAPVVLNAGVTCQVSISSCMFWNRCTILLMIHLVEKVDDPIFDNSVYNARRETVTYIPG